MASRHRSHLREVRLISLRAVGSNVGQLRKTHGFTTGLIGTVARQITSFLAYPTTGGGHLTVGPTRLDDRLLELLPSVRVHFLFHPFLR